MEASIPKGSINMERLEFKNIIKKGVWINRPKAYKPEGKTMVKSKWVFKVKRDRIYRVQLVACGYSQVLGSDYTEYYSHVINDTTFRIVLTLWLVK